jgi:hypothetical protein
MSTPLEAALRQTLKDPAHDLTPQGDLAEQVGLRARRRLRRRSVIAGTVALLGAGSAGLAWTTAGTSARDQVSNSVTSATPTSGPSLPPAAATPDPAHLYPYGFVPGIKNPFVDVSSTQPKHQLDEVLAYFTAHDSQSRAIGGRRPDATHFWLLTQPRIHLSRQPVWILQWNSVPDGPPTAAGATTCVTTYVYDDAAGTGLQSQLACPGRLFTSDHIQPTPTP